MVSSPKPPNPYQTAQAQQGAETGAATASSIINNPNEQSPYGSVNYSIAGWEQVPGANGQMQYVPRYTRKTSLSPDEQVIAGYDTGTRSNLGLTAMQQSSKLGQYLNTWMDPSQWQPWQATKAPGQVSYDYRQDQTPTDRPAIENAIMSSYERAAKPQQQAQSTQLALRGLSPGSQGYSSVQRGWDDSRGEAARQAYLASGQESRQAQDAYNQVTGLRNATTQQEYELGSAWAQANNAMRQGQAQEAFALRNQPINEIASLMGLSQVNMPQFAAYSQQGINAAPIGQYISDNYQARAANAAATNQGLFNLAGSALGGVGYAGGMGNFFGRK